MEQIYISDLCSHSNILISVMMVITMMVITTPSLSLSLTTQHHNES